MIRVTLPGMTGHRKFEELMPTVVVRFPPALRDAVKAHGEANDLTVSQVVRKAVRQYLDAQEPA